MTISIGLMPSPSDFESAIKTMAVEEERCKSTGLPFISQMYAAFSLRSVCHASHGVTPGIPPISRMEVRPPAEGLVSIADWKSTRVFNAFATAVNARRAWINNDLVLSMDAGLQATPTSTVLHDTACYHAARSVIDHHDACNRHTKSRMDTPFRKEMVTYAVRMHAAILGGGSHLVGAGDELPPLEVIPC